MLVSQLQSMFTFPEDLFTKGFDPGCVLCWTQSLVGNVLNTIWKMYYFRHEPCRGSVYGWTLNSRFRCRLKMSSIKCTHRNGNVHVCTIYHGTSFISSLCIVILPKHRYNIYTFFYRPVPTKIFARFSWPTMKTDWSDIVICCNALAPYFKWHFPLMKCSI